MSLFSFDKELAEKAFKEVDASLVEKGFPPLSLILCGAAALIVKHDLKRKTADIDTLVRTGNSSVYGIGTILAKYGLHIISEALLCLHPDYSERVEEFERYRKLVVYTLGPYDLAISKIARGFEKDREDLFQSTLLQSIDFDKLKKLYFEALKYWVGREPEYKQNWDLFEEEYCARFGQDPDAPAPEASPVPD